jgi:pyrroline-5-carboxylate reductase
MKGNIAIIGSGNMGGSIAQGLLNKKIVPPGRLLITNSETFNNKEAVQRAETVIIAVKPAQAITVLNDIKETIKKQLIISVMAGITIGTLQNILGKNTAVVRVMPNLAAKVGKSMSVWVKSGQVSDTQSAAAKTILESIGTQLEMRNENMINAATAISGSGPAYVFYLAQLIENGAVDLGFSRKNARLLTEQTLIGCAELLKTTGKSAEDLRAAVTSKGGTTEAGLSVLEKDDLQNTVLKAIQAAFERAKQLGTK